MIRRDDGWRFFGAAIGLLVGRFFYAQDPPWMALVAAGFCVAVGAFVSWRHR